MNQVEVKRRQIQLWSYMLGLVNLWLFGKKIGDNGIAYLAAALEAFWVLWMLTGCRVPDALGRLLRSRSNRGQYKNAAKMRQHILLQQSLLSLLGALLFLTCANVLAQKVFRMPYSRFIMLLLAPTLLIRTVGNMLLGYFQGDGTELPTAVSCVLRQIFLLGFGLLFSSISGSYGEKVSALLGQEAFTAMYGGVGVAAAILLTELLLVFFLLLVYRSSRKKAHQREAEGMKAIDSLWGHVRGLYRNIGGRILLGLLESLPLWMGLIFYQKSVADSYASVNDYGVYFGKYLASCGLFALFVAASVTGILSKVAVRLRKEEQRCAKGLFQSGMRMTVIHSLFFTVFTAVMAGQLAGILGEDSRRLLQEMLTSGSVLILFVSLIYYFSRLLLLLGRDYLVYLLTGVGDIAFIISAMVMLNAAGMGIESLVYAGLIGAGVYAVLAGVLTCRQLRTGVDWLRTLGIPLASVCLSGLLCFMLSRFLSPHLGNVVTVLLGLVLGGMVYWGMLLSLRCFRGQELEGVPGGRLIRTLGGRLQMK